MVAATWTPEKIAEVMARRDRNQSAATIAAHFACTRNAIIGVVKRELERRAKRGEARPPTPAKIARKPALPPTPVSPVSVAARPPRPLVPYACERKRPFVPPAAVRAAPVRLEAPFQAPADARPLLALKHIGECRWPYDDADGVARLACGAATGSDSPGVVYCPAHRGLAYQAKRAA